MPKKSSASLASGQNAAELIDASVAWKLLATKTPGARHAAAKFVPQNAPASVAMDQCASESGAATVAGDVCGAVWHAAIDAAENWRTQIVAASLATDRFEAELAAAISAVPQSASLSSRRETVDARLSGEPAMGGTTLRPSDGGKLFHSIHGPFPRDGVASSVPDFHSIQLSEELGQSGPPQMALRGGKLGVFRVQKCFRDSPENNLLGFFHDFRPLEVALAKDVAEKCE